MNKINTTFLLVMLLSISIFSQNFWQRINSPTTQRLNSIVFLDSLNGWVSGDSGVIIHTTDGGENWETQFSNDSLNVVNLFFLDYQTGWASAWSGFYEPYGTYILKTTNGGLNWAKEYLTVGEKFANSFYFLNTSKGFAVGYPGLFQRTIDGGTTWVDVNLDSAVLSGFPPYTVKFYNDQYGYACGGVRDIAGVVWRTTDGGTDWTTVVYNLTSEPVYDIHIFDSLNVIAMGGDPEYGASLVKTTDGGNTWNYTLLGTLWYPVDIGFRTTTEGWGPMGAQRKFLYTSDAGESWSELSTPDSVNVIRISFPDTLHGFGIGENGEMVKYVYGVTPVELTSFSASVDKNNITLNWSTATETNNRGFAVERFAGSLSAGWEKIGFVDGNGTSTESHSYSYTDKNVNMGKYRYRLKQIDFDGTSQYSKEVEVKVDLPVTFSLEQNYPNPFNPSTTIKYSIPSDQHVRLNVYNLLGQKVTTLVDGMQKAGQQDVNFNASNFASGVYIYKLEAGEMVSAKKMILIR